MVFETGQSKNRGTKEGTTVCGATNNPEKCNEGIYVEKNRQYRKRGQQEGKAEAGLQAEAGSLAFGKEKAMLAQSRVKRQGRSRTGRSTTGRMREDEAAAQQTDRWAGP